MKAIEKTGKTVDDAIATALNELHLNKEDVMIEILTRGSKGILGFGVKEAKVRVTYNQEEQPKEDEKSPTMMPQNQDMLKNIKAVSESQDDNAIKEVEQKAIQFLQQFLNEMHIEGTIKIIKKNTSMLTIGLEGKNMGILIGRKGETLDAIQYLVNIIANKGRQNYIKILIDTENYRAKREAALKNLVFEMSQKVKQSHKPVILEPMNPYDRRIVHSTLQDDPFVKTYSEGKDPFRKVIIIPNDSQ